MSKTPVYKLWTTTGELPKQLGKIVQKLRVTHNPKNSQSTYAQQLPKFCTQLIPLFSAVNNPLIGRLIHRFHIANNNYSYK